MNKITDQLATAVRQTVSWIKANQILSLSLGITAAVLLIISAITVMLAADRQRANLVAQADDKYQAQARRLLTSIPEEEIVNSLDNTLAAAWAWHALEKATDETYPQTKHYLNQAQKLVATDKLTALNCLLMSDLEADQKLDAKTRAIAHELCLSAAVELNYPELDKLHQDIHHGYELEESDKVIPFVYVAGYHLQTASKNFDKDLQKLLVANEEQLEKLKFDQDESLNEANVNTLVYRDLLLALERHFAAYKTNLDYQPRENEFLDVAALDFVYLTKRAFPRYMQFDTGNFTPTQRCLMAEALRRYSTDITENINPETDGETIAQQMRPIISGPVCRLIVTKRTGKADDKDNVINDLTTLSVQQIYEKLISSGLLSQ